MKEYLRQIRKGLEIISICENCGFHNEPFHCTGIYVRQERIDFKHVGFQCEYYTHKKAIACLNCVFVKNQEEYFYCDYAEAIVRSDGHCDKFKNRISEK